MSTDVVTAMQSTLFHVIPLLTSSIFRAVPANAYWPMLVILEGNVTSAKRMLLYIAVISIEFKFDAGLRSRTRRDVMPRNDDSLMVVKLVAELKSTSITDVHCANANALIIVTELSMTILVLVPQHCADATKFALVHDVVLV